MGSSKVSRFLVLLPAHQFNMSKIGLRYVQIYYRNWFRLADLKKRIVGIQYPDLSMGHIFLSHPIPSLSNSRLSHPIPSKYNSIKINQPIVISF